MSNSKTGDVEGQEDGIEEGEGTAKRVSNSCHRLGSVGVNPGDNSGENGVGNSIRCVSIQDFRHV